VDETCVNINVIDDIRMKVFPALKIWKEQIDKYSEDNILMRKCVS
jgi:hypothetical protein